MILATKLRPPVLAQHTLPRERLLRLLAPRADKRLNLVMAPAGYGKTTLVNQWLQSLPNERWVWFSLDATDNDPRRFWRYLFSGCKVWLGESTDPLLAELDQPDTPIEACITQFINALAEQGLDEPVTLVLDDFHEIHDRTLLASLNYLIDYLPQGLSISMTTRAEPELAVSRWRARRQVQDIFATDLAFSAEECRHWLQDVLHLNLSDDTLADIIQRSEGWAGAIQLLAGSLPHSTDADATAAIERNSRLVDRYLVAEVFDRLSDELKDFLRRCACLPRLSAPLCNALCARDDSQVLIEQLELMGLFVVPLDHRNQWFRFHELFREALISHVKREYPHLLTEARQQAARWFFQQEWLSLGMELVVELEDWPWLTDALINHGNSLIHEGQHLSVQRWLAHLPQALRNANPRLLLLDAWCAYFDNKLQQIPILLEHIERQLKGSGYADIRAGVASEIDVLGSYLARQEHDLDQAADLSRKALEDIDHHDMPLRSVTYQGIGLDFFSNSELEPAVEALEKAIEFGKIEKHFASLLSSSGSLGWILFHQGQVERAMDTCQSIQQWVKEAINDPSQPTLISCLQNSTLAEIHRERNQLAAAEAQLRPLLEHLSAGIEAEQEITIRYVKAQQAFSQGQWSEALNQLNLCLNLAASKGLDTGFEFTLVQSLSLRCHQHLGNDAALAAFIDEHHSLASQSTGFIDQELLQLALLRCYLGLQQGDDAIALAKRLLQQTERHQHRRHQIQALCLGALALQQQGESKAAAQWVGKALDLGFADQAIRVLADEGAALHGLVLHTTSPLAGSDYHRRVLDAFRVEKSDEIATAGPDMSSLSEPLSQRELQVLQLIYEGLANKQIAQKLFLAPATVKAHIRNLYGKLGAASRTDALAKGRELGILD